LHRILVVPILLCVLIAAPLAGQDARGSIVGRVTDATGAVIPGADVRAANSATGVVASTKTNEAGNYTLPYLVPGIYTVSSEITGFKRLVRENVQVRVNDIVQLDMPLQLGDVTEAVSVTAETPLLTTTEASLGQVIDERASTNCRCSPATPWTWFTWRRAS
jgi:hypothetical protein